MKMESDKQGTPTNRQVALSTTVRFKDLREESHSCVFICMYMYVLSSYAHVYLHIKWKIHEESFEIEFYIIKNETGHFLKWKIIIMSPRSSRQNYC